MRSLIFLLLAFWAARCWAETDVTTQPCPTPFTAKLVSLQGRLSVDTQGKGQWQPAHLDDSFCEGSRIQVDAYSRASILLPDQIILRLDEGTVLTLNGIDNNKPTLLALLKGFVHFISRTPKHLEITSPIANAGPEGTEFAMRVDAQNAELWVYEGGVQFFNPHGSVHLLPGQAAQAHTGQAPSPQLTIKPQDAVNWALYYPPILPYPQTLTGMDTEISHAIQQFRQGHSDVALSALANLPPDKQTAYYLKVRAAMLLSVGREQWARQDINTLLIKQPNDADALALQSVLALTQNRKDEAYQLAKQAIASDGKSATAYSALSYAEQGRFALDNALTAAQHATQLAPHDAMTWARQAELELALGLTSQSAKTAQHAISLDANLERTQTVMGFAELLHTDTDTALQRFTQAVRLDSSAPLARLGLGLTKIRQGDLAQGRQDLEIAAILDPNNSLIRSYLGKAYYEEKRNALAGEQFDLAKLRDPKDPTPYFYEAIKKQTENRPVEALEELQKSTALNDNRAVYRSKQLLDQDKAIRGTSVARIFNTLGLEKRALVEASKSLSLEPADASSHRFLSDAYVNIPRQGIAHVSELTSATVTTREYKPYPTAFIGNRFRFHFRHRARRSRI
jgi:Flp pilus assembly protein TadD